MRYLDPPKHTLNRRYDWKTRGNVTVFHGFPNFPQNHPKPKKSPNKFWHSSRLKLDGIRAMPAVGHAGFWLENQVVCSFRGESGLGRAFHIFGKNQHMRSIILSSLRGLPEWMGKISHKMRRWDVRHRWIKHSPLSTLHLSLNAYFLGMGFSSHPGSCVCWPQHDPQQKAVWAVLKDL